MLEEQSALEKKGAKVLHCSPRHTILQLILAKDEPRAQRMKDDLELSDVQYDWIKVEALCIAGDWKALEAMAATKGKTLGYHVCRATIVLILQCFVHFCTRYDVRQCKKYIEFLNEPKQKVQCYVQISCIAEAVQVAMDNQSVPLLEEIKETCTNKKNVEFIDACIAQLGTAQ